MCRFTISSKGCVHCEIPEVLAQGEPGFNHVECAAGIVDGRFDLASMTDNSRILKQAVDVLLTESRNNVHVEIRKCIAKAFSLAQNREPRQSSLKTFETNFFKQPCVVSDRPAPLCVVVFDVLSIIPGPPATVFAIRCLLQPLAHN